MSCAGTQSIHVSNNVARAKTGYLRRFNKGFFSNKWKQEFFVLYVDSTLAWFDEQGSYQPKGAVLLKDVCQYMAVGVTTQYVPNGPPKLPAGSEILHLIGIPRTRSKSAEFVWILCTDQNELNSWLQTITTVLPPPLSPHHSLSNSREEVCTLPHMEVLLHTGDSQLIPLLASRVILSLSQSMVILHPGPILAIGVTLATSHRQLSSTRVGEVVEDLVEETFATGMLVGGR